jgi:hypothetical protein
MVSGSGYARPIATVDAPLSSILFLHQNFPGQFRYSAPTPAPSGVTLELYRI